MYPSCVQSHFKSIPYMDLNLLVSFEFTTVTTMDSQESTCCCNGHLLALSANIQLPYKACFGGAKFDRDGANYFMVV